ncbi:HNH endonuclease [Actinoplanes sp. NPDC048791]|uniref:HNH endonuclease n=1 Tax=Actinoplanes sp. NPDC048791 TaxID=3154623 RepID=UPI0033F9563E
MREIRAFVAHELGEAPSQTDRRVRELRDHFEVLTESKEGEHRYRLVGWSVKNKKGSRAPLSKRLRAEVLSPQRCAQCGRRPLDHGVVLVVDHKIPHHWGGTDDVSNLQPLCEECNSGKKAYYATYDQYADEIAAASLHPEPHGRIGELLKAFHGEWVPSDVIAVVASLQQYQDDWQKRLRELRFLGWDIPQPRREKDATTGRIHTSYRVASWKPWPMGSIRAEIARRDPSNRRYEG